MIKFESCSYINDAYWHLLTQTVERVGEIALPLAVLNYTFSMLFETTQLTFIGKPTLRSMKRGLFEFLIIAFVLRYYMEIIYYFDKFFIHPLQLGMYSPQMFTKTGKKIVEKNGILNLLFLFKKNLITGFFVTLLKGGLGLVLHVSRSFTIFFLVSFGKLTIACSQLPWMKGAFRYWAKTLISVFCWGIALGFLDGLMKVTQNIGIANQWALLPITAMYIATPFLTSIFTNRMGDINPISSMTKAAGIVRIVGSSVIKSGGDMVIKGASSLAKNAPSKNSK